MGYTAPFEWWRRVESPKVIPAVLHDTPSGRVAFGAILAFTVMLVASPQQYVPIPPELRIAFVLAVLAVGAHVLDIARGRHQAPTPTEFRIAQALVGCAIVSVPLSLWPGGSFQVLTDQYLKSVAVFWVLGSVVTTPARFRTLLWVFALSTAHLAVNGVSAYLSGASLRGRLTIQAQGLSSALAANPNDLAMVLCLFLPLTAVLALTTRRNWLRLLAWSLVAVDVTAIFLTLSRAGLLMLIVATVLFVRFLWRQRRRKTVAALAIAVVVAAANLPAGFSERFATAFGEERDGSAQLRQDDQVTALRYIVRHPLVGAGIGSDVAAMDSLRATVSWTRVHNVYLAYGVDLGALGLVLFCSLFVTCVKSAMRVERQAGQNAELGAYASAVRISLAVFFVAGFFSPVSYHFHFYYLAGMAVALKETARRQTEVLEAV
jgi:O-antigen ligase